MPAGTPLPPPPTGYPSGLAAGRKVVLGIRPEHLSRGPGKPGAASVSAPVSLVEPTGAETIVLASVAGERLRASVSPDIRLEAGQRTTFLADTRSVCLFDPATETLIA